MKIKKRGVFVKELNFKIDSFTSPINDFRPYIEKGFKYGHHTSGVLIRESELKKFDSAGDVWGYLKYPHLKDTIILDIGGENIHSGTIMVWE